MSTLLSERLLAEMNKSITSASEDDVRIDSGRIDEIEIEYKWIPGFRKKSVVLWAHEEEHLYYYNSYSQKTGYTACTCYDSSCTARIFIREDGTAFRRNFVPHNPSHGSHYETFMHMHCFNKLREKVNTAPASMSNSDIYKEVIKE